ncbi:unnamed protein product [Eruca vesicaria subsp. sativa]|uniref:Uncharacterized protein n=1 Tax=Eruca vesicaria subsp. sativa TaxID=29727 RepID=A0ABC8JDM8_ERUVS|nr:unnamed protein product [Eruca vesicaria subsp. sativa]
MTRNNSKHPRETEIVQRPQKPQISLNYNYNNNRVVHDEAPKHNLVSTGLRLSYSYGNDERNSSVNSANGSITTPMFQSLGDSIRLDFNRQKNELDQYIKFRDVWKKLQEKDQEIQNMNKKNRELAEKIK